MKKIKHFKINLRIKEIARVLKATTDRAELTSEQEDILFRETNRLQKLIRPAAVYETLPKDRIPGDILNLPPETWVAASTYIVTIGDTVEQEIRLAHEAEDPVRADMLHCIGLEAIEQSASFIRRLINDEAKDDDCELTKYQRIESADMWMRFLEILPGDKIGVSLTENGAYHPRYTSAGLNYWMQMKRKKGKLK